MAQNATVEATESTSNKPIPLKVESVSEGVSNLVNAISSVFTGMATESLSSDGRVDISQLPALLERTASMLRGVGVPTYPSPAAVEEQIEYPAPQPTTKAEPTVLFEDEWKLAISKTTGKILGIFPDNALAQRWYSDEAEEEIASKNALSSYDSAVARCHEQVEIIIKECRRTNRKYRDPDFNLDKQEMCLLPLDGKHRFATLPQGNAQTRKIFKKPQFYVDGATASDVKQGQAADCWFLAGISALTNFKACLTQNYVQVDGDEKVGVYGFVFHRDGEWIYEIVDDFLYTKNPKYGHLGRLDDTDTTQARMLKSLSEDAYSAAFSEGGNALFFAQSRDENETWLPLLEKAFAKAHGDYWAIAYGHTGEAIEDLTGGITTELRTEDILDPDVLWQEILLCNEQFIFGCWTPDWPDNDSESEGLFSGHAYSIMKAVEVDIKGKKERLVLVRNPWGQSEWTGRYSDGSREMNVALLTTLKHECGDDGMFYMSYEDFLRKFEYIDRIRLIGNDWSCAQCWTNIKIPRTKTFLDTRYVFTMDRKDMVAMSLSQLDDRYIRGLTGQYGFTLEFRLEKDGAEHAGHMIAQSTRGINTERSVNAEIELEAGKYNVFLKVIAEFNESELTIKDTIKNYVSTNSKTKLIQLAKKYNFAHMKHGVGDEEDRIFASLTVQEAEEQSEEKPKPDAELVVPTESPVSPTNEHDKQENLTPGPVDNPVTEAPKIAPIETKSSTESTSKKDRSIENWNPVATIGLRLFTRKARVALSVVQESIGVKLDEQTTDSGKSAKASGNGPMILVTGESEKLGNVPARGKPLPLTPKPGPSDADVPGPISPVDPMSEDLSKAFVILDDHGKSKLSSASSVPISMSSSGVSEGAEKAASASSVPISMSSSGVSEGAEKAASAKITNTQPIKVKNIIENGIPTYLRVYKEHIVPETLDKFQIPWEWAPKRGYIYILGHLDYHEQDILFEHSRKLLEEEHIRKYQAQRQKESPAKTEKVLGAELIRERAVAVDPSPDSSTLQTSSSQAETAQTEIKQAEVNEVETKKAETKPAEAMEEKAIKSEKVESKPTQEEPASQTLPLNDETDSNPQAEIIMTPDGSSNNSSTHDPLANITTTIETTPDAVSAVLAEPKETDPSPKAETAALAVEGESKESTPVKA